MITYEYQILETDKPTASVEQLMAFGLEGWRLQFILEWQGKFFYYFIKENKQ